MTKISYIHGLNEAPPDEMRDRGANVGATAEYIPYTAMTQGEMQLALLRQQAEVFARYYPDQPKHGEAVRMLDNALYGGIHARRAFVGVVDDSLQDVARQIANAARFTRPAAGAMIGRTSLMNGIGIGDDKIISYAEQDCVAYATREANKFYGKNLTWREWENMAPILNTKAKKERYLSLKKSCQANKDIEALLNDKMVGAAHHMLYKNLSPRYAPLLGSQVLTKRTLHLAGIGGLHNATGVVESQMSSWVETGILRRNAAAGIGTLGSVASSLSLSPGGDAELAKYVAWASNAGEKDAKMKKTAGIIGANIGIAPALLIPLIIAAIKLASDILEGINKQKAAAMAAANGFGSSAYEASPDDFLTQGGSDGSPSSGTDMLPLLAIGAGAYFLLTD